MWPTRHIQKQWEGDHSIVEVRKHQKSKRIFYGWLGFYLKNEAIGKKEREQEKPTSAYILRDMEEQVL